MIGLTAVGQALDFGELMREHRAMVFSVAWHFLHDRDLADEIAQDVFLSLHKNLAAIETAAHAGFWLRKVAVQRSIDAVEFQPVSVHSKLALKIPRAVKILFGTDIKGLGFAVTYQKFEDGVWFPVSYGGEFEVRAVFFYKRTISVNMTNTKFHRTNVNSSVTYLAHEK